MARLLVGLVLLVVTGCDRPTDESRMVVVDGPKREEALRFSISEGQIVDQYGRLVLLRGINVSGTWKQGPTHLGTQVEPDFRRYASYGFTVIRLLTFWSAVMPERGTIDGAYLDALAQRVEWAQRAGLYLFVDMHQDVYGPGFGFNGAPIWTCDDRYYAMLIEPPVPWFFGYQNPGVLACYDQLWSSQELQAHYLAAWRAVAERLQGYPNVIGADLMNEPYWGTHDPATFERERLQPMYRSVIAALREVRPDWLLFMEPSAVKNVLGRSYLEPDGTPNAVYAPHLYHPAMEIGGAYGTLKPYFSGRINADRGESEKLSAALFIGEWGSYGSQSDYRTYLADMLALYNRSYIGWTYWESGPANSYGLVAPGGTLKPWAESLMEPYPHLLAGREPQFVRDGERYTLEYVAAADLTRPTVIAFPSFRAASLEWLEQLNVERSEIGIHRVSIYHTTPNERVRLVFRLAP
ncbi:MAG: cellulase family glycosylhydrolase [Myxococcales bacterium]|nr:cellulase family glycosylhydrolase [Myxococcales bacterium]